MLIPVKLLQPSGLRVREHDTAVGVPTWALLWNCFVPLSVHPSVIDCHTMPEVTGSGAEVATQVADVLLQAPIVTVRCCNFVLLLLPLQSLWSYRYSTVPSAIEKDGVAGLDVEHAEEASAHDPQVRVRCWIRYFPETLLQAYSVDKVVVGTFPPQVSSPYSVVL